MTTKMSRRHFLATAAAATLTVARNGSAASCSLTEDNPQGPFYVPGAPFRDRLASPEEPGERLRIEGRVLAAPGCEPLAGAVVDVWHANADGHYYGLEATQPLRPEDFMLRGKIRTGEDGRYAFDTILPGWYRVNPTWTRPRHIHYTVSHPSRKSLTTQLYFEGDPRNSADPLFKQTLMISPLRRGETLGGTFDIVLAAG